MTITNNRYFLAIIPPSPIFDQALGYKNYFKDHYQTKASLNSPPHITLHMPFDWRADNENKLIESLQKITGTLTPASVTLNDFGVFPPRVIFIQVAPSEALEQLQHKLRLFCKRELGLFNADYKDRPFHPHITLAFRDLKKALFVKAWEEFMNKKFHAEFLADRIYLMKHDGEKWNVLRDFAMST